MSSIAPLPREANLASTLRSEDRDLSAAQLVIESTPAYRPAYHYSPNRDWLSDPNGLVNADGLFHLCYQHDRYDAIFQKMSWGHAVSSDLLHWQERPPVITPDEALGMCFSGCMVVDRGNTAGFGDEAIIGLYTSELPKQQQSMFVSQDGGRSFNKYAHNPVIANSEDMSEDFRDPKIFWCEPASRWMMSVAGPERIEFWSSPDLTNWQFESQFGDGHGVHDVQWECPDLRYMPVDGNPDDKRWVLIVSINPGAPNGGSGTMYFVGDFLCQKSVWTFVADHAEPRWLDWGCDNYAHVGWTNLERTDFEGRVLSIGWMSNWNYATSVPTAPWRGAMTLIRELKLQSFDEGLGLSARPAPIYDALHGSELATRKRLLAALKENRSMYIGPQLSVSRLELAFELDQASTVGVELTSNVGDSLRIGYEPGVGFFVDRTGVSGEFNESFPGVHFASTSGTYSKVQFEIYLDRCSVEVFFNGGAYAITELIFPSAPLSSLKALNDSGHAVSNVNSNAMREICIAPMEA